MLSVFAWVPLLFSVLTLALTQWVENKGLWYYISKDEKRLNYHDARSFCESMNAHLAVVANNEQNKFLSDRFTDKKLRWIGMSNMRTNHDVELCHRQHLFWENDKTCANTFRSFIYRYVPPKSNECLGVGLETWMWFTKPCTEKHGFICQWECEEFYVRLNDRKFYSGTYRLDHYFNENAVYVKHGGNPVILRSIPKEQWVVIENLALVIEEDVTDVVFHYEAFYDINSYVPYGNKINWKDKNGSIITSDFVCTSCDEISTCMLKESEEKCNEHLLLTKGDDSTTEYINANKTSIKLQSRDNSEICYVNSNTNYKKCKYHSPTPVKSSNVTFDNGDTLTMIKTCHRRSPQHYKEEVDEPDKQMILIVAFSVAGVEFVVIVIFVAIVVVVLRNKNKNSSESANYKQAEIQNEKSKDYPQNFNIVQRYVGDTTDMPTQKRHSMNTCNNNTRIEQGVSVDSDELYQQIDEGSGDYLTPGQNIVTMNDKIPDQIHGGYMDMGAFHTTPSVYLNYATPSV